MSNINIYLCNDTKTIKVNFDGKPLLMSLKQEVSFNMFLSDVIEFNEKYLHPIKEFTLNIVQNIFLAKGKTRRQISNRNSINLRQNYLQIHLR